MHAPNDRVLVGIAKLVLAGVLSALAGAASGESRDNIRVAPAGCEPLVAYVAEDLREPGRRLEKNRDRPGAARSQTEILAGVFDDPKANAALTKLLNCLANAGQ